MLPICTICNQWLIEGVVAVRCGHLYHGTCLRMFSQRSIMPCSRLGNRRWMVCNYHWRRPGGSGDCGAGQRHIYLQYDAKRPETAREAYHLLEEIEKVEKELRFFRRHRLDDDGKCHECGGAVEKQTKGRGRKRRVDGVIKSSSV
uniref:Zf-C3HC4 domain-containing protein n=1 Tax=Anopheles coluzzii TaxID=1518534 RepID=A0A6E8WC69_ANOCL